MDVKRTGFDGLDVFSKFLRLQTVEFLIGAASSKRARVHCCFCIGKSHALVNVPVRIRFAIFEDLAEIRCFFVERSRLVGKPIAGAVPTEDEVNSTDSCVLVQASHQLPVTFESLVQAPPESIELNHV